MLIHIQSSTKTNDQSNSYIHTMINPMNILSSSVLQDGYTLLLGPYSQYMCVVPDVTKYYPHSKTWWDAAEVLGLSECTPTPPYPFLKYPAHSLSTYFGVISQENLKEWYSVEGHIHLTEYKI